MSTVTTTLLSTAKTTKNILVNLDRIFRDKNYVGALLSVHVPRFERKSRYK